MMLYKSEKPLDKNTIVFRTNPRYTKPEIKQYLTKSDSTQTKIIFNIFFIVYGLDPRYTKPEIKQYLTKSDSIKKYSKY